MTGQIAAPDDVDRAMEAWRRERPDLDGDGMEISDRIRRVAARIRARAGAILSPHGVGPSGYAVLAALRRAGKPFERTPTQLSREVLLTSGAMTHRIDRLEEQGLVERRPSTGDRRSIGIRLTPEGARVEERATSARFEEALRAAAALSDDERARLRRVLRKMEAGLQDTG
ncbi:MAG: MarR family transcriptional regulator [Gemmatimonadota bacterium]|nr:MarR family transcriptional regulator [Gemmatimonadota bacterium]